MSRTFLRKPLEGVAIYWRVSRLDGVTLGFTSHDRDLEFNGLRHRAAPGMLPSAIRRTASLELDSAEVAGALSHGAITEEDLSAGRFEGARVEIGLVDWENLDRTALYFGKMGDISSDAGSFEAELRSAKADLEKDLVPRTSPTCRAQFCGPGCSLSAHRFTHEVRLAFLDVETSRILFDGAPPPAATIGGTLRWIDGPRSGITMRIVDADEDGLIADMETSVDIQLGTRALLREGCDHTLATCAKRFGNSINFQGEPFLPGNDALIRYPTSSS